VRWRAWSDAKAYEHTHIDAQADPDRHDSCVDSYTHDHSFVRASKDSYTKTDTTTDTNGCSGIPIV
jgi:hypothetical protein